MSHATAYASGADGLTIRICQNSGSRYSAELQGGYGQADRHVPRVGRDVAAFRFRQYTPEWGPDWPR